MTLPSPRAFAKTPRAGGRVRAARVLNVIPAAVLHRPRELELFRQVRQFRDWLVSEAAARAHPSWQHPTNPP